MKKLTTILLSIYFLSIAWAPIESIAQIAASGTHEKDDVVLKWLGNAGWEIRVGKTIILLDPFLTRQEGKAGVEWKTDEDAVLKAISKADFIFAGHSHADHIGDVPFIAKRFGSKVIGSRTTTNLALTAGVDKAQVITIRGGEKLGFQDFSVQVIESQHGFLTIRGQKRQPKFEEVTRPWGGPIMGKDFVDGGSYLYYFTLGKHRLLHQSTGNFIEEKLRGLRPDVALLNTGIPYDLASVLRILNPKLIVAHHFDAWAAPFSEAITEASIKRARGFERKIRAVDSQIKVIIPELLKTYTLD